MSIGTFFHFLIGPIPSATFITLVSGGFVLTMKYACGRIVGIRGIVHGTVLVNTVARFTGVNLLHLILLRPFPLSVASGTCSAT